MENETDLLQELELNNYLSLEDIPEIDLYMDQVIQLFEKKFAGNKRNSDEKIMTKTMINNYAKGKLFFPIQNKRYTKEHLILISLIYHLKGTLSIGDIKDLLQPLNKKVSAGELNLEQLYESFLHIRKRDVQETTEGMRKDITVAEEQAEQHAEADRAYIQRLLLIASFANISNFYKRAAEKLIDDMNDEEEHA